MPKTWNVYHRGNRWHGAKPCTFLPQGQGMFWLLTKVGTYAMRFRPFRGIATVAKFNPGTPRDESLVTADRVFEERGVKKVKVTEKSTVKHLAAMDSEMFREHLPILEVLALLQYGDGTPREPGYLGMWTQGGTWFLRVQDKTGEAQMTAEGRTAEEAWDTLAVLLASENPPWEPMSRRKKKAA